MYVCYSSSITFRWKEENLTVLCACPSECINRLKFTLKQYLQHLRLFHAHQPTFHLTCGIQGCQRTFFKFRTFENHVSLMHREEQHHIDEQDNEDMLPDNDHINLDGDDDTDANEINISNTSEPTFMTLQKSSALMLLKMKEVHKLTQVTLQGIIDDVTGLCQNRLSAIHSAVNLAITNAGFSPSDINGLNDIFDSGNEFGQPFIGLETQHQQFKFYKENFKLVVS